MSASIHLHPLRRVPGRRGRPAARVPHATLDEWLATRRRARDTHDPLVVATRLLEVAALFEREWRAALRTAELGDPKVARVLLTASVHGGELRHRDLVELTGIARSTMTHVLDRAESEGYVNRAYPESDERTVRCHLTRRGHELARRIALVTRMVANRFLDDQRAAIAGPLTSLRDRWRPTRSGYGHRWARRQPRDFDDW